jgi:hypothetical protein
MPKNSEIGYAFNQALFFKLLGCVVGSAGGLICAALLILHFSAVPYSFTVATVLLIVFASFTLDERRGSVIGNPGAFECSVLIAVVAAAVSAWAVIAYGSDFVVGVCVFVLVFLCAAVTAVSKEFFVETISEQL